MILSMHLSSDPSATPISYDHIEIEDLGTGASYYPFQPVMLEDRSVPGSVPIMVPAIYVKALAHLKKVEGIMKGIRMGADLLGIILGLATLGSGSVLFNVLSVLDLGLTTTDLAVALSEDELMKTEEGRQFLEAWNKVAVVGGIATAGPLLLHSIFSIGAKLFGKATLLGTRNFIMACFLKIVLEIKIANFTGKAFKIVERIDELARASRYRIVLGAEQFSELWEKGVIFVAGETKVGNKVEQGVAVLYKGEVIANGSGKEVKEALKDVLKANKNNLDNILNTLEQTARYDNGRIGYKEGLFDAIDVNYQLKGFDLIDKIQNNIKYGKQVTTEFKNFDGYFIRNFDLVKKTFTFNHGFLENLPKWVVDVKIPLVEGKGIPTQAYFTLRQMKLLGIEKGEIQLVKMAQIQNLETMGYIAQAMKEKGIKNLSDVDILSAPSNEYMKTVMTQAGYEMTKGSINANELTVSLTVSELKKEGFLISKDYMNKFGLKHNTKLFINFDISISVKFIKNSL